MKEPTSLLYSALRKKSTEWQHLWLRLACRKHILQQLQLSNPTPWLNGSNHPKYSFVVSCKKKKTFASKKSNLYPVLLRIVLRIVCPQCPPTYGPRPQRQRHDRPGRSLELPRLPGNGERTSDFSARASGKPSGMPLFTGGFQRNVSETYEVPSPKMVS